MTADSPVQWKITGVRDWRALDAELREADITWALAEMSRVIGIPYITEHNVGQVLHRIGVVERLRGLKLFALDEDMRITKIPFTRDMIERRVGMVTNADPLTPQQFHAWVKDEKENQC